jgi:PAS domain S-box-containing protein
MAEAVAEREAALRASEQRFRTYVENSSDIVFVLSPTGVFGYISPNSQGALGYAMDEVVGRPFEPFVHPDDLDVCRDFLSKVFAATGKPAAIEYRVRHKDGAWRWYSANAALIRDPGTETPALLGIARDITGRKQQEDALRQSELRLRAAVDNIPHDFWSCDADGRYLMLNATAVRKWNRAETLIGKRPEELDIPEEMRAIWTDNNRRALSGETVQRELRYEIDGTLYRQLDLLAPILDGDAVCGLVGLSIDISELARVEDSLRETNEQLEALLESAPIAIVVVSSSGVVTQWNRAAEQISGWRREEVLGNPLPLNPDADNEATLAIRARLLAGGELHGEQLRTIRKDGQAVDLNIYTTPLHGAAEHSGRLLMLCEDITERLQADARRSELEELLRQAQKMEAVGQLAGGIAHDFNNLMTVVLGQIDMIRKRWNDPALAQRLDEIDKAGQRAATLTRQLLAFSRRQMLQPRVVDLNAVVADIRLILDRSIGENYALDIRPGAGLWPVLADPTQIGQVVVNLVVNARDALPEGGEIRISTRNASAGPDDPSRPPALPAGDYVLLAVRDDGTGMDAATKARLFEPFFTTKDVGRGTGLGLSTAYGIVMQSGGHIRVESELGAGTTVEIWLPRSEGEAELPKQVEIPPAPPRGDATLLLVEDAGHVRDLVRDILEECGYTVLEAGNGHEALSVAAAYDGPIDLLLTDMVMPGMNGRKLAEAVQAARPGIRVLFMSGYSEESAFRAAEGRAGLAFLQKPFTPEDLGWKLHELLAQPRG